MTEEEIVRGGINVNRELDTLKQTLVPESTYDINFDRHGPAPTGDDKGFVAKEALNIQAFCGNLATCDGVGGFRMLGEERQSGDKSVGEKLHGW